MGDAMVENKDKLAALSATTTTNSTSIKTINNELDNLTQALADITKKLNNALTSQQQHFPTPSAARKRKTADELNTKGWTRSPSSVLKDKQRWSKEKKRCVSKCSSNGRRSSQTKPKQRWSGKRKRISNA